MVGLSRTEKWRSSPDAEIHDRAVPDGHNALLYDRDAGPVADTNDRVALAVQSYSVGVDHDVAHVVLFEDGVRRDDHGARGRGPGGRRHGHRQDEPYGHGQADHE